MLERERATFATPKISDIEYAPPGYVCFIRGSSTMHVRWICLFSS